MHIAAGPPEGRGFLMNARAGVLRALNGTSSGYLSVLFGALLAGAASAAPASNTEVVRDLPGRVGPIIGSALACTDVARPRVQTPQIKAQLAALGVEQTSQVGQKRRSDRRPPTSGLPRQEDILRGSRHVSKVPFAEVAGPSSWSYQFIE